MRRLRFAFGLLILLGLAPAGFADVWDYMVSLNGTSYCANFTGFAGNPPCTNKLASGQTLNNVPGVSSNIDETEGGSGAPGPGTGLGTATITFNPGTTGTFFVDFWLFEQLLDSDADHEFATLLGSPASNQAGLSYQIDVPGYDDAGDPNPDAAGSIGPNTQAGTLDNTNHVPGPCPGPDCDFTSMALGFSFTLGANEEEILTFRVSSSAPAGAYIEQTNPTDGDNGGPPLNIFFTGTAVTEPTVASPVPEPGSILLLATMASILMWAFRSRRAALKETK